MEYLVIFEKGESNYNAYAPDLPGCGVVGETLEEVRILISFKIQGSIQNRAVTEVAWLFRPRVLQL